MGKRRDNSVRNCTKGSASRKLKPDCSVEYSEGEVHLNHEGAEGAGERMLICVLRVSAVSKGSNTMRRALVIIVVLAVVVAASWFGYEQFGKAKAEAAPDYETVTVESRGYLVYGERHRLGAAGARGEPQLPGRRHDCEGRSQGRQPDRGRAGACRARHHRSRLRRSARRGSGQRRDRGPCEQLMEDSGPRRSRPAVAALDSAKAAYTQVLKGSDKDELAAARPRWSRRASRWNKRNKPTTR